MFIIDPRAAYIVIHIPLASKIKIVALTVRQAGQTNEKMIEKEAAS